MKRISIIAFIFVILNSCNCTKQSNVRIVANNDTILSGDLYLAELYVPYKRAVLPAFYIFRNSDTLGLEIDSIKKCAIFRATYRTEGEKVFNGFVKYVDLKGNQNLESFSIKYYVKSK